MKKKIVFTARQSTKDPDAPMGRRPGEFKRDLKGNFKNNVETTLERNLKGSSHCNLILISTESKRNLEGTLKRKLT